MERKTVPKLTLNVPINRRKLKEAEKARRVTFYRNGDYFDAGVKVALRGSRPFPTLPHLLDYLSQKSRIPAKKLFAAADGRPIKSLEQLEDGAFYVISSDGKFESLPYGSVPPPKTSHVADALPVRQEDLQLFRPASRTLGKKKKKKKKETEQLFDQPTGRREGRLLTIAAREGGARATLLFNDRNPPPFENVLRDFGRALGLGHVHKMSTPSGRQVRSISQLKNEFQDVDTFFLDETSDDLSIADEKRLLYSPNRWRPPESKSAVSTRRSEIPVRKTEIRTSRLHLDWIHGYSGGDLIVLENGELVYAVGAAVVLYRRTDDSQRHYLDHTEDVCSLCVHPSGRMMASGQISSAYRGAAVNIWLVQSLQTIASVVRLAGNPISIAFSSHNFVLLSIEVGQEEDCLTFWDWESDALLARVEMRKERLTGGAFHPREPDLAVTFGEHHLAFWRKRQDGLLARIDALSPGHSGRTILSWAFIGESSLAVGDSSGYLTLWALLPGDAFRILKEVKAHQSEVRSLLAMREGTLVSGGDDQIKAWDSRQKLLHLETTGLPEGEVKALCLQGPTDAALYVGTANTILDGSVQSSFRILIQGLESECLDLAVDSEGMSFVSVDRSHCVCRWTIRNLLWKTRPQVDCCCVGYHPEGLAITVGGSNGKLLVLHAEGGLVVATISVADAALKTLAYDADATALAIGCEDGNIYICESKNHGYLYKMHTVLKNEWPILQVDWSSDGECLMTAYRKDDFCEVALWRVADSKRLKSALAQTMDWPQHTCTLSHNILGIWKRIKDVFYLSCNRRGSKLAAGSQDGHIRIFKYPCKESDQSEYEEQKQSTQPLAVVRFLNMDHLISASGSAIFIWNLKK